MEFFQRQQTNNSWSCFFSESFLTKWTYVDSSLHLANLKKKKKSKTIFCDHISLIENKLIFENRGIKVGDAVGINILMILWIKTETLQPPSICVCSRLFFILGEFSLGAGW